MSTNEPVISNSEPDAKSGITDALTVHLADEPGLAAAAKPGPPPLPITAPPKPARWKELLVTVLVAALVGAVVGSGFVVGAEVALGRFTSRPADDGVHGSNLEMKSDGDMLTQKGKVTVPAGGTVEVFYPGSYAQPPALTWKTEGQDIFTVSEQTRTGFKVKSNVGQAWDFRWEATGLTDKGGADWRERKRDKK